MPIYHLPEVDKQEIKYQCPHNVKKRLQLAPCFQDDQISVKLNSMLKESVETIKTGEFNGIVAQNTHIWQML